MTHLFENTICIASYHHGVYAGTSWLIVRTVVIAVDVCNLHVLCSLLYGIRPFGKVCGCRGWLWLAGFMWLIQNATSILRTAWHVFIKLFIWHIWVCNFFCLKNFSAQALDMLIYNLKYIDLCYSIQFGGHYYDLLCDQLMSILIHWLSMKCEEIHDLRTKGRTIPIQ
jgi:hypothetical protein